MATTVNPFDIGGTSASQSDLGAAQQSTAQVTAAKTTAAPAAQFTGYDAAKYDPTTMKATTYDPSKMTAQGYDANQAGLTSWDVNDPQTVAGQFNGLIAQNSPLIKQARTSALQSANQKGLINSTMAVGAGEQAAYNAALPIAQADAATFANAAKYNADASNANAQFNTNAKNTAAQFTATALNTAASQNQQAENTANQYNANAQNSASQFNATAANQASQTNAAADNSASQFNSQNELQNNQFNTQQQNAVNEANSQREQQASTTNAAATNAQIQQSVDNAFKAKIASSDNQTKMELAKLQSSTQLDIANVEASYKQLMQSTQSASDLYQQTMKNISDIMSNPDLDANAVTAAVNRQLGTLKNGMAIIDAMNNSASGIADLIDFSADGSVTTPAGAGSGTTTAGTTPGTTKTEPTPLDITNTTNFQQLNKAAGNVFDADNAVFNANTRELTFKDPALPTSTVGFQIPKNAQVAPSGGLVDADGNIIPIPTGLLSSTMTAEQRNALSPGLQQGDSPADVATVLSGAKGVNIGAGNVKAIGMGGTVTLKGGTFIPAGAFVDGNGVLRAPNNSVIAISPADKA